jgi:hypothetical protein
LPRDKQNLRFDAAGKERDAHCVPGKGFGEGGGGGGL